MAPLLKGSNQNTGMKKVKYFFKFEVEVSTKQPKIFL